MSTSVKLETLPPIAIAQSDPQLQARRLSQSQRIPDDESAEEFVDPNKGRAFGIILCVALVTFLGSFTAGIQTVELPAMAEDVHLESGLLLWPGSINALVCGCTLLLCASISDLVGGRWMLLAGSFLQAVFNLATGLSKTGTQVIAFRGLAGLTMSFCLPSSVSIITHTFATGKRRNIAFASMGGGQPAGFSLGLILGGVFASTIGWRWGFYFSAIANVAVLGFSAWLVPRDSVQALNWARFKTEVDWVGILLISSALAMLSYALAAVAIDAQRIKSPTTLTLLITSVVLFPSFIFWMNHRERVEQPALIPNSLWRNRLFTCMCIIVFLVWGAFNATEQVTNFFFQYAQKLSPIQTSVRFLPEPVSGAIANIVVGLLVHKVNAAWILNVGTVLACIPPLLMALAVPTQSYWELPFPATLLIPIGADCLFTIAQLLITSLFPSHTQALAGGVFQTVSQIGKSVGLALSAVISSNVLATSHFADKASPDALNEGYQAAFWYCFAVSGAAVVVSALGLRKIGLVGLKRD